MTITDPALLATFPLGPPDADLEWVELARTIALELAATAAAFDESAELPRVHLQKLHDSGLDTALLPEELGGAGISFRAFGEILAVLSKACPATACVWLMHVGAAITLIALSEPEEAAFFAEEFRSGKRFSNALSEPTSGNLFLVPLQAAEPVEGGWTLSGAKRFVSGCEIADYYLVNALVDGHPNFFGVDRSEAIEFIPIWDTMGLRASRSQLMSLHGLVLREDRRCRPPGGDTPNPIGTGVPWLSIGVAEAAFEALVEHASARVIPTTGKSLAHMQWIQFEVAEAHAAIQGARLLASRAMWLADHNSPETLPAAILAKLTANQVAQRVAELGVKVGGATGYLRSSPIQRHFRDAQAGALMAYSVEVCRDYIGKSVLGIGPDGEGSGFG